MRGFLSSSLFLLGTLGDSDAIQGVEPRRRGPLGDGAMGASALALGALRGLWNVQTSPHYPQEGMWGGEAKTVAADLLGFPAQMANLKYESEKMHSDLIQILVSPHI